MPTSQVAEPAAPGSKRTPSQAVAFGRAQWQRKWRTFASQWTQPQLMKLAAAAFEENALHSSQIHGFTSGKLRDPAPKVLMVIGYLNQALAAANGHGTAGEFKIPGKMADLYRDKHHMTLADGTPMGPAEVFLAVSGIVDLKNDGDLDINDENVEHVCKSLGKYLRTKLMQQGIDFMDPEVMADWGKDRPVLEKLIYGQPIPPQDIDTLMLAKFCGVDEEELLDHAVAPAL